MEDGDLSLKELVKQAVTECNDIELLDLVYKLLISDKQ